LDELVGKTFKKSAQQFFTRQNRLGAVTALLSVKVPTYAETKVNITHLTLSKDKKILRDMFFRAFSYLWIKENPIFQGSLYKRPVASGRLLYNIADKNENKNRSSKEDEEDSISELPEKYKSSRFVKNLARRRASAPPELLDFTEVDFNGGHMIATFPELPGMTKPNENAEQIQETTNNSFLNVPGNEDMDSNYKNKHDGMKNYLWIKQCVGDSIPSNAVKSRVEKMATNAWNITVGSLEGKKCQSFCF